MAVRINENGDDDIVAEINITPLTDIFLVLLIIFMISSSAIVESSFDLMLPLAKMGAPPVQSAESILVTISAEGRITVNEEEIPEEALDASIREKLTQTSDRTVVIRGDESISLRVAVKIMDAARSAGARRIALATRQPG